MTLHYDPLHKTAASIEAVVLPDPARARDFDRSLDRTATRQDHDLYRTVFNRVLDVAIVLVAAPVVLLALAVMAFGVALDGGNLFYCQSRVGRGGRIYRMWKMRSMVTDADQRLDTYLEEKPAARAERDSQQKLKSDPRITRFGAALCKTSLDELPQLGNVLMGDMSLVGPRPMMPSQQALYPDEVYCRRRPGITGLWQVSHRNESTFADRARFDLDYDQSVSFGTDVRLILATVRVVLHGTGY